MNDIAGQSFLKLGLSSDYVFVPKCSRTGNCFVVSHIARGEDLEGGKT
jgi:hypothetical protein